LDLVRNQIKLDTEKKNLYESEITKMKAHMDPTSLTLNDVMQKLQTEDPSRFREVMRDLQYEGRDPEWYNSNFEEQLLHLTGKVGALQEDSIESLTEHRSRLIKERHHLVTELNKIQQLLKLAVDHDKHQEERQLKEIEKIQHNIRYLTKRSSQLGSLIKNQNEKMLTLQKERGPSGLTQADLVRFNAEMEKLSRETKYVGGGQDVDAMSEITTRTDESELRDRENILDLRIMSATFDRAILTQILTQNRQELEPSAIQTFLAVDFFNHDTKSTDVAMGIEPIYNTLFSFKNTVDDFYVAHLEKDSIQIDLFYVPKTKPGNASGVLKLGTARLPLIRLIEKGFGF